MGLQRVICSCSAGAVPSELARRPLSICRQKVSPCRHAHLRYLNPFPRNLGELIKGFKKVVIPELNMGQLRTLIRAKFLIDAYGLNKVQGKPFSVGEIVEDCQEHCSNPERQPWHQYKQH